MSDILKQMQEDLYSGRIDEIESATRQALKEGMPAQEILNQGLIAGMDVVGRDFKSGDLFIPEVLLSAKAMHAGLEVLRPSLASSGASTQGKVVIGTVAGDLHDIGKNLVSMMLQGAGFEIIDLGTDVSPEQFVEAAQSEGADLVGMSALLTTTMPKMKITIDALAQAGLGDRVGVLVGGAPVTAAYAEQIGADAYAGDAVGAVDTARQFVGAE
jgi:5-methyltetrahydrofolate--homocysteine methyltransferase